MDNNIKDSIKDKNETVGFLVVEVNKNVFAATTHQIY